MFWLARAIRCSVFWGVVMVNLAIVPMLGAFVDVGPRRGLPRTQMEIGV